MGGLRDKLAQSKLANVSFMIVNEQEGRSRAMYWELKRKVAAGIPVYQQSPLQDDVWSTLQGEKDDVLIYDRCGKLTFHIVLPYSFLNFPYVEAATRATYHRDICGCPLHLNTSFESGFRPTHNDTTPSPKPTPVSAHRDVATPTEQQEKTPAVTTQTEEQGKTPADTTQTEQQGKTPADTTQTEEQGKTPANTTHTEEQEKTPADTTQLLHQHSHSEGVGAPTHEAHHHTHDHHDQAATRDEDTTTEKHPRDH